MIARLRLALLRVRLRSRLAVTGRPCIGPGVRLEVARGGRVELGDGAVLGAATRLHVARDGSVRVGDGARLGERCAIACHERVEIGAGAVLGDGVVIADFDHRFGDVERPVRVQGIRTAPVLVGERSRIGDHAALLRGVRVGPGASVGVRSVVVRDVGPGAVVQGVPAHRAPDTPHQGGSQPAGAR